MRIGCNAGALALLMGVYAISGWGCAAQGSGAVHMQADECVDDRDCPTGFECVFDGEAMSCLPPGSGLPPQRMECASAQDCPADHTCELRGDLRVCIPPSIGPGDACDPRCPVGQECRGGVCLTPDLMGSICEFDPECGEGMLCIAGRCTWDPRDGAPSCDDSVMCPDGLTCEDGMCVCMRPVDCPQGTTCEMGACVPEEGGCVADSECPTGMLCDAGRCTDADMCGVVHPDLTGTNWQLETELQLREALPGFLSDILGAIDGPLQFISGRTEDPDLGLPGFVEDAVGRAIRNWAENNIPRWVLDLLGAIGDVSDALETWKIRESMILRPGGERDAYTGSHTWEEVCFEYRRRDQCGTPQDITGWRIEPSDFNARAACGTFNIDRHEVGISIGAIIAWAVNLVVEEATGYPSLGEAIADARMIMCEEAGHLAHDVTESLLSGSGPSARSAAESWCNSTIDNLAQMAIDRINAARVEFDVLRLSGYAPIVSERLMEPGIWQGSLFGGDFPGTFRAFR